MEDKMIILIVFGILLTIGAAVLFFIAFKVFFKYLLQEKRCNAKTKGIVKRFTFWIHGRHPGVALPVVTYNVNGVDYKVAGPEYKGYNVDCVKSENNENKIIEHWVDEHGELNIKYEIKSFLGSWNNPLAALYPVGREVDVYYCQKNPKLSYVIRYCNKKFAFYIILSGGIFVLFMDIMVFIICLV